MTPNGVVRVRSMKAYAQIALIFILMLCVAYMALKSNQVADNRKRLPRRLSMSSQDNNNNNSSSKIHKSNDKEDPTDDCQQFCEATAIKQARHY